MRRPDPFFFLNKIAVITGGASGIGRAVAEELARRGAKVLVADINSTLAQTAVQSIRSAGNDARAVAVDVMNPEAVEKMIDDTAKEFGRIDYLFNNAGIAVFGEARHFTYDDWRSVIETNLYGVVNGVAAAYPLMIEQGFGHIINTASLAGLAPAGGLMSYVASKYGIVGLTNALRVEGADYGVRASVVCPGLIDTPIKNSKSVKIDMEKALAAAPRLAPPEYCARAILKGVERNDAFIVVTPLAKIMWLLQRLSPNLVMWMWKRQMKKFRRYHVD